MRWYNKMYLGKSDRYMWQRPASCIEAVSEGSAGYRTCRQLQGGLSAGGRDCA